LWAGFGAKCTKEGPPNSESGEGSRACGTPIAIGHRIKSRDRLSRLHIGTGRTRARGTEPVLLWLKWEYGRDEVSDLSDVGDLSSKTALRLL
jgi:hypothetical protein